MSNDEGRERLQAYVSELARRMGLGHWRIVLGEEPPNDDDCAGQIIVTYGRKRARMRLMEGFADEEELRDTVVHELLHCYFEPMIWALNNGGHVLGETFYRMLEGAHRDAMECAIDDIASAWAQELPLISELEVQCGIERVA